MRRLLAAVCSSAVFASVTPTGAAEHSDAPRLASATIDRLVQGVRLWGRSRDDPAPRVRGTVATALAAGSDEEVVQRLHVRYETYDLVAKSCRDVIAHDPETGSATFQFRYEITGDRFLAPHRYAGRLTFSLGEIVIHLPRTIVWPGMSDADRERAARLRRAIDHHEIGHVRVAEAVRDALNAQEVPVEPDVFAFGAAAHAQGRDGFDRFKREERAYDALTDHGRKQHLAPGELAGPDTVLLCGPIERTRTDG